MRKLSFLLMALCSQILIWGQSYTELEDTKEKEPINHWEERLENNFYWKWGNTDTRYKKYHIPDIDLQSQDRTDILQLKAWRGERVNAQAVLFTKADLENITFSIDDLSSKKSKIKKENIKIMPVSYVMTDELNKGGNSGCGKRTASLFDSSIVADVLNLETENWNLPAYSTRPVWINIKVPASTKPGIYSGKFYATVNKKLVPLDIELKVLKNILPEPKDWSFHLDLWQNPYAFARYHNVEPWSKEHFQIMEPSMKMLANAGQKVITTTITDRAWNGQTQDPLDNMIRRTLKKDGTWDFDYTIFDNWVEFMMKKIGINAQINCYTMIPWAMRFAYFDESKNQIEYLSTNSNDPKYKEFWAPFIEDFAKHLKKKGWFEITTIAMDERRLNDLKNVIKIVKEVEPEFKITLAGVKYENSLEEDLYDYCLNYGQSFPEEVLEKRKKLNLPTSFYTACSHPFPNTFTFSAPAEASWYGWYAMAAGFNGYLRWAYNSWTINPLQDSRFREWAAGDTYLIYPDARSSIRFERLIEGVQDYEKIRILKEKYAKNPEKLEEINKILENFHYQKNSPKDPHLILKEARKVLNSL